MQIDMTKLAVLIILKSKEINICDLPYN